MFPLLLTFLSHLILKVYAANCLVTTPSTSDCLGNWKLVNPTVVVQNDMYASHCINNRYSSDCYYGCPARCLNGCTQNGNCYAYWRANKWDHTGGFFCVSNLSYSNDCYYTGRSTCAKGVNVEGNCYGVEYPWIYDYASHCLDRHSADCYYGVPAGCRNGNDVDGYCYGRLHFDDFQVPEHCKSMKYSTDCYYGVNGNCAESDVTGNCYGRATNPKVYGIASHCPIGRYSTDCYYSVAGRCSSHLNVDGNCYFSELLPSTFYNYHCLPGRYGKDCYYSNSKCNATYAFSSTCWSPPSDPTAYCPQTCTNGCDELGLCKGWDQVWDPYVPNYCTLGYWGFGCQKSCPINCLVGGCTAAGNCLNYQLQQLNDLPIHCKPGYWGDDCASSCLAICAFGCTTDGACINWDLALYDKDDSLPAATICKTNTTYGGGCGVSCTYCANGCTISGKCIGWELYHDPDPATHCLPGYYNAYCSASCTSYCPKGLCSANGMCLPFDGWRSRNQVASHCLPQRKYGPFCAGSCAASCGACRIDGYCAEEQTYPALCGPCAGTCTNGTCSGYNETADLSLPASWCLAGSWNPACTAICPKFCLNGCNGRGRCIGWETAVSTELVSHCVVGLYGPLCKQVCPINCLNGCTGTGYCKGWETYNATQLVTHCFNGCKSPYICDHVGYYGQRCEYSCPAACAPLDERPLLHCTGTGKCLGWKNYSNPTTDLAVHCQLGRYGPKCYRRCSTSCRYGCTVTGNCYGFHLANSTSLVSHCNDNRWGPQCFFNCPTYCCGGNGNCTGNGKCYGWEKRFTPEGPYLAASHCKLGLYGDDCRLSMDQKYCAQKGVTFGGYCIGLSTANASAYTVCVSGFKNFSCNQSCSGSCPSCGYCGNRQLGSFLPECNQILPGPPSLPQNLSVTTGDHVMTIYWEAPADNGNLSIWGYSATVLQGPSQTSDNCGSSTSPCVGPPITLGSTQPLLNFIPYNISLVAINSAGIGDAAILTNLIAYPVGPRPLNLYPTNNSYQIFPTHISLTVLGEVNFTTEINSTTIFRIVSLDNSVPIITITQAEILLEVFNTSGTLTTQLNYYFPTSTSLKERKLYRIEFMGASIQDSLGYSGFSMNTMQLPWLFIAADITPPILIDSVPGKESTNVLIGLDEIVLTFDDIVFPLANRFISIFSEENGNRILRQQLSTNQIVSSGSTVIILHPYQASISNLNSRYCIYLGEGCFKDAPPYGNLNLPGPNLPSGICFQTGNTIPQYMRNSATPMLLELHLLQVRIDLNSTPSIAQFKNRIVSELALILGLSITEAESRFEIGYIEQLPIVLPSPSPSPSPSPTSIFSPTSTPTPEPTPAPTPPPSGLVNVKLFLEIIDTSTLPLSTQQQLPLVTKSPATLAEDIRELAGDSTSVYYNSTLVPNLALTNVSFTAALTNLHFYLLVNPRDIQTKDENGHSIRSFFQISGLGAFYTYGVILPKEAASETPLSASQIVTLFNHSKLVCSLSANTQPIDFTNSSTNTITITRDFPCTSVLISRKRYVLFGVVSSRSSSLAIDSSSATTRAEFTYTEPGIPLEAIITIAVVGVLLLLWIINKLGFAESRPNELIALIAVLNFFTTCVFANYVSSQGEDLLFKACVIVIIANLIGNALASIYILSYEIKNNDEFNKKAHGNVAVVAAIFFISMVRCESLKLLQANLFHFTFLHFPFSNHSEHILRFYGIIPVVLESIPQVIIVYFFAQAMGTLDSLAKLSLAWSIISIVLAFITLFLTLILGKQEQQHTATEKRLKQDVQL